MDKFFALAAVSVVYFLPLFHGGIAIAARTPDGSEEWGYVEVRPSKLKLHIFSTFHSFFLFLRFWDRNCYFSWIVFILFSVFTEAHMFWWLYRSPYRVEDPSKPWPIILWLQGGPVSTTSKRLPFFCFVHGNPRYI